jgi:hypothetical protein
MSYIEQPAARKRGKIVFVELFILVYAETISGTISKNAYF